MSQLTVTCEADPTMQVDLSRDSDLESLCYIHDEGGGPRAAYAWAIGRVPQQTLFGEHQFFTADLDTNKVEDFIIAFYTAYNRRFGQRY